MKQLFLCEGWQCKARNEQQALELDFVDVEGWIPASVPGIIHQDLLAVGRIPDPFFGLNEHEVQWVGKCDWLYRCSFVVVDDFVKVGEKVTLCCDGLDTFATLWLNEVQILQCDNMFLPQRVSLNSFILPGKNELRILFESALRKGKEREEQYGSRPAWNGDTSRLYVRKAQYHYGWDWGPTLLTAGPWRALRLEVYQGRIADIACPAEVAADLQSAILSLDTLLEIPGEPSAFANLALQITLYEPDGTIVHEIVLPVEQQEIHHTLTIEHPRLWWPHGYGEQALYQLTVVLRDQEKAYDQRTLRLGLRRLRLVQDPLIDEPGTTFFFEVNNTPLFCGGANWIPADSFLPRITSEQYRAWLQLAADANMVMVRVWGGGIYEEDVFYDVCDELGLLVWQDFPFACGVYPAPEWFQESVRLEAEAAVRRLRHHPGLALWCGNNEDYAIAESVKLIERDFPARVLYEQVLPSVCAKLDPSRPYWRGSPYGGATSNQQTVGDRHTWEIWHGPVAPYQNYGEYWGRFVSEFGMEAAPALATIEAVTPPEERYPQSQTLDLHNKSTDGPRRLAIYLNDNVRMPADLESYVYATQFIQAEALSTAVRSWRRRWKGPGRYTTAGALIWQLNDCWPAISWAIVDYWLRPKAAYYTVRRELAPLTVGLARNRQGGADLWAVNGTGEQSVVSIDLQTWTLEGTLVDDKRLEVMLAAQQASELETIALNQRHIISARLYKGETIVSRATLWPEPWKYLTLPDPEISLQRSGADLLQVSVRRPAKGVFLSADVGVVWSDNMLDIFPGDTQTIFAQQLLEHEVRIRSLASLST
jgi:beta-mannosidase